MFNIFLKLLVLFITLFPLTSLAFECSSKIDKLSLEYNVSVHCNKDDIPSNITGVEAPDYMRDEIYDSLHIFFKTFGKSYLSANIEKIILLKDLRYSNFSVGGMNSGNTVLIRLADYPSSRIKLIYLMLLNHEFSSNVFKKNFFTKRILWANISNDYERSRSYLEKCLKYPNFARDTDETLLENGFLTNYSVTNPENDFNVFAEKYFLHDEMLFKNIKKFNKLKEKLVLLKEFYRNTGFKGEFPSE